jgi:hypothetical protein
MNPNQGVPAVPKQTKVPVGGHDLTPAQAAVLGILAQYGPLADHALVPLAQHQLHVHQSSSGIRSRRAELTALGLVESVTTIRTGSGRSAGVYAANLSLPAQAALALAA